uniref:IstB-like ATP-binding domain-containing protein n=1 Tax=Thermosporothrix sp. COM3 TaxID=2490863 RepID=A0A455SHU7_9CHLR|nr:hypothetical protein KTC_28080 [Thermosporothrix sp. COM3]
MPRYRQATFERFDASVPGAAEAYTAALAYAEQPGGWLVLLGSNGCGKTHLAVAIAHERLAAGEREVFLTVPDHLRPMRRQPMMSCLRASGRWSCWCSMIWGAEQRTP